MQVPETDREVWLREAAQLPAIQITEETACTLDLLATGALAPLDKFDEGLEVPTSEAFEPGARIALRDGYNERLAILIVEGRTSSGLVGSLEIIQRPRWRGFTALRKTPVEVKAELAGKPARIWMLDGLPSLDAERFVSSGQGRLVIQVTTHCAPAQLDLFTRVRMARNTADRLGAELQVLACSITDNTWRQRIAANFGAKLVAAPEGAEFHAGVAELLAESIPPKTGQGFCLWFTGLPSSGKSTIANEVVTMLEESGRRLSFLDGDVVRTHLSKGLGFSREDRDTNILRIGWVSSQIVRHHGIAVCAAVSPYEATREKVRQMVGADNFVLIHVDTPAEICETRDVKGFYAQARKGVITGFTGVDDPYEIPENPSLRLATTGTTALANAERVMAFLNKAGFLRNN
jgi:adenylyl-sulfate kinase